MKNADEWYREWLINGTGNTVDMIKKAQRDALEHAAEIVSQQDQIIDPRPTAKKLIRLIREARDQVK